MNVRYFLLLVYFCLSIGYINATEAPTGNIRGTITTSDGEPAAFVNVMVKEHPEKGTTTGEDGTYVLRNLKEGTYTIIVSSVGFGATEREVVIRANQTAIVDFVLTETAEQLAAVEVIDSRTLNEKSTTIGKTDIKLMDLPQSVTIIDKQVMERQQTLRLSDVLMNTNGVYIMGTTGGSQEEIAGRGFAFSSSNTFKNGVRFNNGIMPETSALEKVEVLKGSSAVLFGQVAAGGVLNLVTKKPKFENGGELTFRTGSYDFYKPSLDIYGAVNNSKHVAYRVNTSYEKARSFRDGVQSERVYFNPSLLFKLNKKTQILLEGDYLKDNRTLDYGTGAVNYVIAKIPRDRFLGASWSYYAAEQRSSTLTFTHQLNENWQLKATTAFQGFSNDNFGTTRPNNGVLVKTDGTFIRGLQRAGTTQNYYLAQVDATTKFNTGSIEHNFLIGADIDKYQNNSVSYTYKNPLANPKLNGGNVYDSINIYDLSLYQQRTDIPALALNTLTKNPINRNGVYVQDLVALTSKLKVLAGVRFSAILSNSNVLPYPGSTTKQAKVSYYDQAFSPRFGLVYQPAKEVSLFSSYSNSFTLNTATGTQGEPLPPSFIDQYEAGIKTDLLQGVLSTNITAYKIVNSNLAQPVLASSPNYNKDYPNAQELAGEVTSKGLEVDIATKSVQGFSIMAGYSYNDTRYTKSKQYIEGSRLRYNPSHTANASLYYSFSNTLKGLNLGLIGFYMGDRVAGRSTRTAVNNDAFKLMTIPNYFQFDASAGYTYEKVSLRVKVSNLLNQLSYNVHDDNSVNPIAPRMFSATVAYKW